MKITEAIKEKRLMFDGGMGTMLQAAGLPAGTAPEVWNISHPDKITEVHRLYIESGCDILTSNTFGVNILKYGADEVAHMTRAAFSCMKNAAKDCGKDVYFALDIGPLGRLLKPYGDLEFEDAVSIFAETVRIGASCGADVVLIETMNDSYETKAAVLAAKENCDLPIFVTNVYDKTHKLMTGADVGAMVSMLEGLGVDAIGMNCSLGPVQMAEILPKFIKCSSTPIIVQPNAGLPVQREGKIEYDIDAETFSDVMVEMAKMGACILGGCCGTTPEYIALTKQKSRNVVFSEISKKSYTSVSSYTHAVYIGDEPIIIGERINPTGKSKLKEALRTNNMSYILSEAVAQQERGAHILDVNVGLPEIDEEKMMLSAIKEIQAISDLPLQIDTVNFNAMESACRAYNGKPLVNSVNGSEQSMDAVFPIVRKYGGAVIALTMDEGGIPQTAEGRVEIARRIMKRAAEYGIDKKDIIVDPLALTVSSDQSSGVVTLEAIKIIREELGLNTSLGVSNISFGLPQREIVTSTFYIMALEAGLNCAIMNPNSVEMMKAYRSYCTLRGYDAGFEKYMDFAASGIAVATAAAPVNKADISGEGDLQNAIIKGMRDKARALTESMLDSVDPMEIINSHIIPALNTVGEGFENKTVYLPQLLMSAEASQAAFETVKERLPKSAESNGKIVLATVKGDIHDIGKNIVKVLLENFGFSVIDLGRDVPAKNVVDAVNSSGAKLVALSALMTTTVPAMADTIELLRRECPTVKVMVGGAVLTQEYADMIGADAYSPDAMGAVRFAQELFS
ncbi:MAG: homocysteine methyltransferase [Ruminococcaceae bacterium]|nr:homocysteine methyltransferase [Oscillospiraceae bacterium]